MAFVLADRVQETSTTAGTGAFTLNGAVAGYKSFATGVGASNTTYYTIYDATAGAWEVGYGSLTGSTTLNRTTVFSNSLGTTALINFAGNTSSVFVTYPASKSVYQNGTNSDVVINTLTVGLGTSSIASNTALGYQTLNANTTGSSNTVVGYQAGLTNQAGYNNTFLGYTAGIATLGGYNNTYVGAASGYNTSSGAYNTALGYGAGYGVTTTTYNVAVGYQAGYSASGDFNIFIGSGTGTNTTGSTNIAIGYLSGSGVTSGSNNVIVGGYSGTAAPISGTGSNYLVLSDGAGNVRQYFNGANGIVNGALGLNATTSTTPNLSFNASNSSFTAGAAISGNYLQSVLQNTSGTAGASTNYVLSNDLGTDSTYYGEFGMNSSVYSGASVPADFFSINNGLYFSGHDGDVTVGSGNGKKLYLAWGTTGQSAHVINATGAIGLNTNLAAGTGSGTTNFGTAGQMVASAGTAATPVWAFPYEQPNTISSAYSVTANYNSHWVTPVSISATVTVPSTSSLTFI